MESTLGVTNIGFNRHCNMFDDKTLGAADEINWLYEKKLDKRHTNANHFQMDDGPSLSKIVNLYIQKNDKKFIYEL